MLKERTSAASQHPSIRPLPNTKAVKRVSVSPSGAKGTGPLSGKTALVTGSTSGIGLGIAKALIGQGANLVMNGFGDVDLARAELTALAKKKKAKVLYHPANLAIASEVEAMVQMACEAFGGIDILVNNAGIQHVAPVDQFPTERWDSVLAINLTAAFHTTRLVMPHMRERNWGRIINVASVHGLVASIEKSAYVAAKHGLVGLTKVVALETAKTGITCNAICPGWVRTPLVEKQIEARAKKSKLSLEQAKDALVSEKQPSGDFVTIEELAELALFLCGDGARQVRGVAWAMDGGWTAQ
jgi:3-hydroxybutyrate dehydrogenase